MHEQVNTSDTKHKTEALQDIIERAVSHIEKGDKATAESKEYSTAGDKATTESEEHYKAAGVHIAECKKRLKLESNLTWAEFCKQHFGFTARRADQLIMIGDGRTTLKKMRDANSKSKRRNRKKSEGRPSYHCDPAPETGEFCRAGFLNCAAEAMAYATKYDLNNVAIDQEMVDAGQKVIGAWTARVQTLRSAVAQGGDGQAVSSIPAANGAAA